MALIKEITQQALTIGYLSTQAKKQIQVVLANTCDSEDIDALIVLERAIIAGQVNEEPSKRIVKATRNTPKTTSAANLNLAYQIAAELAATAALALTMPQNIHDKSLLST
jgi:deoxycytidylate deaminase